MGGWERGNGERDVEKEQRGEGKGKRRWKEWKKL